MKDLLLTIGIGIFCIWMLINYLPILTAVAFIYVVLKLFEFLVELYDSLKREKIK